MDFTKLDFSKLSAKQQKEQQEQAEQDAVQQTDTDNVEDTDTTVTAPKQRNRSPRLNIPPLRDTGSAQQDDTTTDTSAAAPAVSKPVKIRPGKIVTQDARVAKDVSENVDTVYTGENSVKQHAHNDEDSVAQKIARKKEQSATTEQQNTRERKAGHGEREQRSSGDSESAVERGTGKKNITVVSRSGESRSGERGTGYTTDNTTPDVVNTSGNDTQYNKQSSSVDDTSRDGSSVSDGSSRGVENSATQDDTTVDDHDFIDPAAFEHDPEHESAVEDDSAPFTGFQNMLDDLLDDDEDEFVSGSGRSGSTTVGGDTTKDVVHDQDASSGNVKKSTDGESNAEYRNTASNSLSNADSGVDSVSDSVHAVVENPFLDDDDDEEDYYAVDTTVAGSDENTVGSDVDSTVNRGSDVAVETDIQMDHAAFDDVVERAGERYSARDAFPAEYEKRRERSVELNAVRDAGLEKFQEEVHEWEQEQGIEKEAPKQRSDAQVMFAKQYDADPVMDVVLDSDGVPQEYSQSAMVQNTSKQRYKYFSKDKRMNTSEMAFFRATRERKSEALKSTELAERLLPPVGKQESEKGFRARARRITRALEGKDAYKKGARSTFGLKEQDTLQFLAMFRYATASHISRMFSEPHTTAARRLQKLRSYGLVMNKVIFGTEELWVLTDAGMLLSGMELVRTTDARMTFSMFPHQFTVNNTAAHLWGAGVNVLGLADYPQYNKTNLQGRSVPGESLVSELEIQSAFTKQRAFGAAHVFRPQIIEQIDAAFRKWENAGGVEFGQSPEMHEGNEYMWTILPPTVHRHAYHVPDLVVKRERNADGSPNSIAVEIEIYNKPQSSYERTLRAYASDKRIFGKVIWVCKGVGSARKLEKAAHKTGLKQEGRISIVPILTEDGVFKGRDLWLI